MVGPQKHSSGCLSIGSSSVTVEKGADAAGSLRGNPLPPAGPCSSKAHSLSGASPHLDSSWSVLLAVVQRAWLAGSTSAECLPSPCLSPVCLPQLLLPMVRIGLLLLPPYPSLFSSSRAEIFHPSSQNLLTFLQLTSSLLPFLYLILSIMIICYLYI